MTASEWLEKTYNESIHEHEKELGSSRGSSWMNSIRHNIVTLAVRPWCVCEDGTILSIQGSRYHNSNPRRFTSKYNAIELGTVRALDEEYASKYYHESIPGYSKEEEESNYPFISHIYHHFLVSDLEKLVSSHGGILGNYFTSEPATSSIEHTITLEDYGIKESKL